MQVDLFLQVPEETSNSVKMQVLGTEEHTPLGVSRLACTLSLIIEFPLSSSRIVTDPAFLVHSLRVLYSSDSGLVLYDS